VERFLSIRWKENVPKLERSLISLSKATQLMAKEHSRNTYTASLHTEEAHSSKSKIKG
jgi:hypothetical protein